MDLGKAIKQLRKQKNYKQKQFCEIVEITQSYLSLIESNKKKPSLEVLEKIASKLETPFAVLFWFTLDSTKIVFYGCLVTAKYIFIMFLRVFDRWPKQHYS